MAQNDRTALILYGSETGHSQNVAEELESITERLRFSTRVVEMDAVKVAELSTATIVIFAISTTGQGDIPANGRKFWKSLLRKRLPPDYLQHVGFTTFGLGDSSYPMFNYAARKLNRRLEQLGAKVFFETGEADEQHAEGTDFTFLPWTLSFRKELLNLFPLPEGLEPIPSDQFLVPKWKLDICQPECVDFQRGLTSNDALFSSNVSERPIKSHSGNTALYQETNGSHTPRLPPEGLLSIPGSHTASMDSNVRLTPPSPSHWQDVRHLKFSIPSRIDYIPGDILTIFPKNFPRDVDAFLDLMDWTEVSDEPIAFYPSDPMSNNQGPPPVPNLSHTLTLRTLLTDYIDINSIPRRSFFATIALLASDEIHKERLLEFADPANIDDLYDYTTRPRRSILETLSEFPSVKIPWQWAASILPSIRPRQFSIASGGAFKHPAPDTTNVELLVAIVHYKTVMRKTREGVCTRYLAHMIPGTRLTVMITKGGMGVTEAQASKPIVMIGPGTGVAPMRSLIQERAMWSQQSRSHSDNTSSSILFYGGRNRNADFFFQEEWEAYQQSNQIPLQVITAFSRDQKEKIYVQDRIREEAETVHMMLNEEAGGIVFVCGSSGRMPKAVKEALTEVFVKAGAMERSMADQYVRRMEKEGRQEEVGMVCCISPYARAFHFLKVTDQLNEIRTSTLSDLLGVVDVPNVMGDGIDLYCRW